MSRAIYHIHLLIHNCLYCRWFILYVQQKWKKAFQGKLDLAPDTLECSVSNIVHQIQYLIRHTRPDIKVRPLQNAVTNGLNSIVYYSQNFIHQNTLLCYITRAAYAVKYNS